MSEFFSRLKRDYLTVHHVVPIAMLAVFLYCVLPEWSVSQPPGILAAQGPVLTAPSVLRASFPFKKYSVTPLADYELTARVLDKERYHWGRGADISPVDLVLGWKELSDTAVLKYFSFHLSGRWYTWHAKMLPLPEDEINNELDNNHLVPATAAIEHQIKNVRVGQVVHIEGLLVSIDGDDGYNWHSSVSIGSTGGPMSCKLIYVMKFEIVR